MATIEQVKLLNRWGEEIKEVDVEVPYAGATRGVLLGMAVRSALASGADLSGADLSGADLSGADLSGADLSGADLSGAYLSGAYLSGADLRSAALRSAALRSADLSGADLSGADLSGAYLSGADLSGADLSGAYLSGAYLSGADLRSADLSGADLSGAVLSGAVLDDHTRLPRFQIPQEGELVVFKKLRGGVIAKLRVPPEARRTATPIGRKCRAEFVEVLEGEGHSQHDYATKYAPGQIVRPDEYDPNPLVECSHGIHFFLTREEAAEY